ncbi:MAG TPA: DUF1501 domain-containing protein [Planctomycetaceae bacterium]|nr:DUF1501 domain-containing protein [Planctomycetaceae bacterium]
MLTLASPFATPTSRRALLQAGGAGLLGLSLPKVMQAEAEAPFHNARAKSVIFLFLFGGPSSHETFDLKPFAPDKIRGHFSPIASRTPGLQICEKLPLLAERSDKYAVVRTFSHDYHDHSGGGHYIQTGKRWHVPIGGGFNATPKDWPSMGSVVDCVANQQFGPPRELPNYAVVPNFLGRLQTYSVQLVRPGEYAGWLGRAYDPVTTRIDKRDDKDDPYFRDCTDAELTFQLDGLLSSSEVPHARIDRRQSLLEQFDRQLASLETSRTLSAYDRFQQRAMNLVTSSRTRAALDLSQEKPEKRDRYGRHLFGQSTLMARRLVEAGVRFVTVHWDGPNGYGWDSHINADDVGKHLLPGFDQATSALLDDLAERGLLDETLVVAVGEMGRTHTVNRTGGRDHWATLFPGLIAGAGVRGGIVYGESDKDGAYPSTEPLAPERLAATIYHALGIDPEVRLPDPQGRPVSIIDDPRPLTDLFG